MLRTHTASQSNKNLVQQDEQRKKKLFKSSKGKRSPEGQRRCQPAEEEPRRPRRVAWKSRCT